LRSKKQIITEKIKSSAEKAGFSACGVSPVKHIEEDSVHIRNWLENNMHGDMLYMENHFDKRVDASKMVDNAKSVISVLLNYYPLKIQKDINAPKISKYAYGKDYHFIIKDKLRKLFNIINNEIIEINGRIFVDSAPVLERYYAMQAGLGWIGKNSNLINKELGSFVFIGELIVDVELEYDAPIKDFCGTCTKCIDACPTNAIVSSKVIDARKCISYLTIEHKKKLPLELRSKFNNWVFGCDICQDVCPWNSKLKPHNISELMPNPNIIEMTKEEWYNIDKEKFNILFKDSALKRTKFEGLKRNLEFLE